MRFILGLCLFLSSTLAKAEYRVYELAINDTTSGSSRIVTTTLDPLQYSGYYPVQGTESVALQATWMCWGRTDSYTPYCDNPRPAQTAPDTAPKAK